MLTLDDLARELGLLRSRAALGTRAPRVSLDDLAGRVGEPKSTIHAYLSGKRLAPADLLDRIVIALGADSGEQHDWAEAWFRVGACHEAGRKAASTPVVPERPLPHQLPHQLPLPVDRFTGREDELVELGEVLGSERVAVVSGTAGVGKTALALRWAHEHVAQFPDGQLHVDLRGYDPVRPMSAAEAAARFLRALGVRSGRVPRKLDERAAWFRSLVADRRMLIVLDNACNSEHVRELLPGTPTCSVIVTSRDSLTGLVVRHGARRLDLDVLPVEDATTLLRDLIAPQAAAPPDPDALAALADQCARLPLALRVAAEFAATQFAPTIAELVAELATGAGHLDVLGAGEDPRTALRGVFSWSYRRLDPGDARAFRLIGLHPEADATVAGLAALLGIGLADMHRTLGVLARAHLLREVRRGRFGMHNLLRSYARELAAVVDGEDECRVALDRLRAHYLHTSGVGLVPLGDEVAGLRVAGRLDTRDVAV